MLIYNILLVSGVQQGDSVMHIHISILFVTFSHIGYYRILSVCTIISPFSTGCSRIIATA